MFVRLKGSGARQYLQIVRSRRCGNKVQQQVVGTLGRYDKLLEDRSLDGVIRSLSKFSQRLAVLGAVENGSAKALWSKEWGSYLVFDRLWHDLKLSDIISELAGKRKYQFDMERAVFASVLQRLIEPGSDLSCSRWVDTIYGSGFDELQLQHLYRAMGFLDENKDVIEKSLFQYRRTLFDSSVDLVFFDTTSLYFEGEGAPGFVKYGYSKDHRPDRKQIIVGVVMSRKGVPLCCEFWPGNSSDAKTVARIIKVVKKRFSLGKVILVCDRGMATEANVESLEGEKIDYIVGVRLRREKDVREKVLGHSGRYHEVKSNLLVKEVELEGKRYIVCVNPDEAEKERKVREAIVEALALRLKDSPKSLIGNKGYRHYLKTVKGFASIDWDKVKEESRFDGKFVLYTNTKLSSSDVALAYKGLWQVEYGFRHLKSLLATRPVFHHKEEHIKGHVFSSFLSLVLMVTLNQRLEEKESKVPWDELMGDLKTFQAVRLALDGKEFLLRTEFRGKAYQAFKAVGINPPPVVQSV